MTKLANVSSLELKYNGKNIKQIGVLNSSHKILSYSIDSYKVILTLDESSLKIDSDLKGNLLENISIALIRRIQQIEKTD